MLCAGEKREQKRPPITSQFDDRRVAASGHLPNDLERDPFIGGALLGPSKAGRIVRNHSRDAGVSLKCHHPIAPNEHVDWHVGVALVEGADRRLSQDDVAQVVDFHDENAERARPPEPPQVIDEERDDRGTE
jgi:hypothetical protein